MGSIWDDPYVMNRGGKGPLPNNKARWNSSSTGFNYKPPGGDYLGGNYGGGISQRPGKGAPTYMQKIEEGRNKYKIQQATQAREKSNADQMMEYNLDDNAGLTIGQWNDYMGAYQENQGGGETNWWDKIGSQLGADGALGGVKGWLDLGVKGMEAYTGYQQVGLAREQNQLGRDAFSFQKAAWNKDYDARKIAYNTNARDVNAWKAAQTPGGYTMSELVV